MLIEHDMRATLPAVHIVKEKGHAWTRIRVESHYREHGLTQGGDARGVVALDQIRFAEVDDFLKCAVAPMVAVIRIRSHVFLVEPFSVHP